MLGGNPESSFPRPNLASPRVAASVPMKIPSEKQCPKVIESLLMLRAEGWQIGSEVTL